MKRILHLIFKTNDFSCVLVITLFITLLANVALSQVKGVVYIDYDLNGRRTNADPTEIGVAGVRVQLFIGANPVPFTTITNDLGEYSFDENQVPADSLARVEFSNFPETFFPSMSGLGNATDVQFVKAPALSTNFGIANDDEFCQGIKDLMLTTACYVMGDPLAGGSAADDPALILFNHKASGLAGVDDFSMVKLATAAQIGSTWIASFQRDSRRMLVGAIVRRHVGLGPLGTGGFYYVDLGNGNQVKEFLDVKTIGIDTGPDPHIDPVTGLNVLPASKTARSRDSLSFHLAGKVGMGGVQLTRYQDTLFMVNLYDKKLYSFKIGKPLSAPQSPAEANVRSYTIPHPNCSNGDFVPWALKYYRNKMYLGVVCTAERSQKKSDLKGGIYEFNPGTGQFRNIFEFPLGYRRDPLDATQGCDTIDTWKPWSGVFPKQCNYPLGSPDPVSAFLVNPQPILSDIEFDDDGSMFIGMLDRGGLQTGQNQPGIAIDDTLNYYGFMSGDLLRAQRNPDGTYTMESNGTSGMYVADGPSGPGIRSARDKSAGPGGGEFFFEDYWINAQGEVGHAELTNGGIFKLPGDGEVLSSAFDPIHQVYLATGFLVFDTKTGKRKRGYAAYSIQEGSLGKSGGVGDLTAACESAPLAIGNRIWFDANGDGIQDPNEPGVDGLVLTLHDVENGGEEVGRDTTANGGQFYFSDFNVAGGLKRNHSYEIRQSTRQILGIESIKILEAAKAAGIKVADLPIDDNVPLGPKIATQNANENSIADLMRLVPVHSSESVNELRNSDAVYNLDSSAVSIALKTSKNSENNYTFDIGWMLNLPKASMGDYAWYDLNRNGIQDLRKDPFGNILGPELAAKGVIMELYNDADQFVKSDTTDVTGAYRIKDVESGQYYVKFNPVSYPTPDFVVTDLNKGSNDSLDNDIERAVYQSSPFTLVPGQHDPRWDIGFFRTFSPEISDPCVCDSTILYLPGDNVYTKYVYREKVTIKATPGGKWAIIPLDAKKNVYTYGLYEDNGEGYIDSIDLSKKQYFFTELPDSLGVYEFKFAHKSQDGYALAATDGVDTLSIGAICYEVKEQYDMRLGTLCANGDKIQLERNFPNGTATYYFMADSAFVFREGFDEFTLLEAAVARGPITEIDPKMYKPNSTISLYMKWMPFGGADKKGVCQKSIILNVNISNTGACSPSKDLELTKMLVGDCRREVGSTVQFKVVVTNKSTMVTPVADSVYVQDYLPVNLTFLSATSTRGVFNPQTMKWGPLKLVSGQSDTLTISVRINNKGGFVGGSICNEAEIVSMVGVDSDSQPGNKVITEDDYGVACVSVPLKICLERRDTVIILAPAGYQTYKWLKNGVQIVGATSYTLEVGEVGSYTVELPDGKCPVKNCCPAIVEAECICPENICIPLVIKQIKSK